MSETGTRTETRTMTAPDEIRGYFAQVSGVLGHLAAVTLKDRQTAVRDAGESDLLLGYLARLSGTMRALGMKYGWSGFLTERLPSDFEIAAGSSGFPTVGEVRRLEGDLAEARASGSDEPDDLRPEMVDFILRHKRPPRDLQFLQSQSAYRAILRRDDLFLTRVEPKAIFLGAAPNGNDRWLLHWGAWDASTSQPVVYLLALEDSGKAQGLADRERMAALSRACLGMSQSSLLLLTIASKLDEDHATIHPKSLKRILIGPLHSTRFASVDPDLASALRHVGGDWRLDWVLGWTVETLRSKGSRKMRSGIFGERLLESFIVDPKDFASVRTGTTEISTRLLMPYDVFQALDLADGSPLAEMPKFVVAPDGRIASHL